MLRPLSASSWFRHWHNTHYVGLHASTHARSNDMDMHRACKNDLCTFLDGLLLKKYTAITFHYLFKISVFIPSDSEIEISHAFLTFAVTVGLFLSGQLHIH